MFSFFTSEQRPNPNKSASLGPKPDIAQQITAGEQQASDSIKVQIQGSNIDLSSDTETTRRTSDDTRHISFDDSCKKDDGDEVSFDIPPIRRFIMLILFI